MVDAKDAVEPKCGRVLVVVVVVQLVIFDNLPHGGDGGLLLLLGLAPTHGDKGGDSLLQLAEPVDGVKEAARILVFN